MSNLLKINGIPTKIRQHGKGYWELVVSDLEIAKQLAPDYMKNKPDENFEGLQLAVMQGGQWGRGWQVTDRRRMSDRHDRNSLNQLLFHVEDYSDITLNKNIFEVMKNDLVEKMPLHKFENKGNEVQIAWRKLNGQVLTQDKFDAMNPDNIHECHYVHKYKEARAIMSEIKQFWADFKGNSLEEAAIENPFASKEEWIRISMKADEIAEQLDQKSELLSGSVQANDNADRFIDKVSESEHKLD